MGKVTREMVRIIFLSPSMRSRASCKDLEGMMYLLNYAINESKSSLGVKPNADSHLLEKLILHESLFEFLNGNAPYTLSRDFMKLWHGEFFNNKEEEYLKQLME